MVEHKLRTTAMLLSICITTHQHPRAVEMLDKLIQSTLAQDYGDGEIVVSDDSVGADVQNYCRNLPVHYVRNERRGKSSINMNNAINHAQGDIIKPMFGDDYFVSFDTLSKMVEQLDSHWGFATSTHSNDRPDFAPYSHRNEKELALGENTYGCPSAMIFKKTDLRFDEELIWLMDCEFYSRMFAEYGPPMLMPDVKIGIREWDGQQSNTAAHGSVRLRETEYVGYKYAD